MSGNGVGIVVPLTSNTRYGMSGTIIALIVIVAIIALFVMFYLSKPSKPTMPKGNAGIKTVNASKYTLTMTSPSATTVIAPEQSKSVTYSYGQKVSVSFDVGTSQPLVYNFTLTKPHTVIYFTLGGVGYDSTLSTATFNNTTANDVALVLTTPYQSHRNIVIFDPANDGSSFFAVNGNKYTVYPSESKDDTTPLASVVIRKKFTNLTFNGTTLTPS